MKATKLIWAGILVSALYFFITTISSNESHALVMKNNYILSSKQDFIRVSGRCERGGQKVKSGATESSTKHPQTYPGCTVRVMDAGTSNLTTIYSDGTGTSKTNPFIADTITGNFEFWVSANEIDIQLSGGISPNNIPSPFYWAMNYSPSTFYQIQNEQQNAESTPVAKRNTIELGEGLVAVDDAENKVTQITTNGVDTQCINPITLGANGNKTSLTVSVTAGQTQITLPSRLNYKGGQWVAIEKAGVNGEPHISKILKVNRRTRLMTLETPIVTTVSNVTMRPDNYVPFQEAIETLNKKVCASAGRYMFYNKPAARELVMRAATEGQPLIIEGAGENLTQLEFWGGGDGLKSIPLSLGANSDYALMNRVAGSATLTCNACLSSKWVGRKSSLVKFENRDYFIVAVPDTSTLVLDTAQSVTGSIAVFLNPDYHTLVIKNLSLFVGSSRTFYNPDTTYQDQNRGWGINLANVSVVNHLRISNIRVHGFRNSGGIYCSNCQTATVHDSIFRNNGTTNVGFIGGETTWLSGGEPNVLNLYSNQFDFQADPMTSTDLSLSGLSSGPDLTSPQAVAPSNCPTCASSILDSVDSVFLPEHLGRVIRIYGGGTVGGDITAVIMEVISPTKVRLSERLNKTTPISGKTGVIFRTPTAALWFVRANNITADSNTIQGNFGKSSARVSSLRVEYSSNQDWRNTWIEDAGGSGGASVYLYKTFGIRFRGLKTNNQGACNPSNPDDVDQHCWDMEGESAEATKIEGTGGSLSILHYKFDANSSLWLDQSNNGTPDFSMENGPQKIIYGPFIKNSQYGSVQVDTGTLYDEVYGKNFVVNPTFSNGLTGWTQTVSGIITPKTDGLDRYKNYIRLNATAKPESNVIDGVFEQTVSIPDGRMDENYVLAFDMRYISSVNGGPTGGFVDLQVIPTTGGTGYNYPPSFKYQIRSDNATGFEVNRWYRVQMNLKLAHFNNLNRNFKIVIRCTKGATVPIADFTNFMLQAGRHASWSNEQVVTNRGGVVDSDADIYLKKGAGGGIRSTCVDNDGKVIFGCVSSSESEVGSNGFFPRNVTQTAHGLGAAETWWAVYKDTSNNWVKADGSDPTKAATGIVRVLDVNTLLEFTTPGVYTQLSHGFSTSAILVLGDTPGSIVSATEGDVRQKLGEAFSTDLIRIYPMPASIGGGGSGGSSSGSGVPTVTAVSPLPYGTPSIVNCTGCSPAGIYTYVEAVMAYVYAPGWWWKSESGPPACASANTKYGYTFVDSGQTRFVACTGTNTLAFFDWNNGVLGSGGSGGSSYTLNSSGSFVIPGADSWGIQTPTYLFTHATANTIRVFKFRVTAPIEITRVTVNSNTNVSGGFYALGIYNDAGTTKLLDTGAVSTTTWSGTTTITVSSVTLQPDVWYWLAETTSSNSIQMLLVSLNSNMSAVLNGVTTVMGTAANSSTAGVLPSTLGTITPSNFTTAPWVKLSRN